MEKRMITDADEKLVYRGKPSQAANVQVFVAMALLFLIAISLPTLWKFMPESFAKLKDYYVIIAKVFFFVPAIVSLRVWMVTYCHQYQVSTQRLRESYGILSKTHQEMELYRVKDITLEQPFFMRLFKCGNIILDTSDRTTPIVILQAIKYPDQLANRLRSLVEQRRTEKGVREFD